MPMRGSRLRWLLQSLSPSTRWCFSFASWYLKSFRQLVKCPTRRHAADLIFHWPGLIRFRWCSRPSLQGPCRLCRSPPGNRGRGRKKPWSGARRIRQPMCGPTNRGARQNAPIWTSSSMNSMCKPGHPVVVSCRKKRFSPPEKLRGNCRKVAKIRRLSSRQPGRKASSLSV